ncbi:DUF5704 domain-containing protein [Herbinix luporum]|uniref:Putative secreted protein n=1 Tax=Herbinix luporum TaxID=1679721 RepID=A0A0K8J7B8_9FIRM|nr:DUF5704 domain-containing protein [Herbinix luporum]CUH93228.1 putative secreted protein [Herbinix luporum]
MANIKDKKKILFAGIILIISLGLSSITKADSNKPNVKMKDGKIIFRITTKAASNNIRYRTIGFTISTSEQLKQVTEKGLKGPDAPPTPNSSLLLLDSEKEDIERTTEKVTTEFSISEKRVKAALKDIIDLDKLSEDTYIYLNAIFEVYQVINGKEVKLKTGITTWKDIVSVQPWANPSVFKNYFNIPVKFDAGLQPNNLYYEAEGKIEKKFTLESLEIGKNLYWKNEVNPTAVINGITYTLEGFYAKSKLTKKEIERKMVGNKITAKDIINSSVKVLYGGMDIYMIYKPSTVEIRIDAKDIDTGNDIKTGLYSGVKKPGDKINEAIDTIINLDSITYSKTRDFYFSYEKSDGSRSTYKDKTQKDEDPIKFQVPLDVKTPSRINVKVYYKKAMAGTIPITVKAISADTGAELKTLITETATAGANYNYTVSETITSGGKTYDFTGEWKWQYKKNSLSAPTVTSSGKGIDISFKLPSAEEISGGITVNVYYSIEDTATDEIDLRVVMVTKRGAFIEEISKEKVTPGQAINKSVKSVRVVDSITYQYQDKWDYTYKSSSHDITKIGSGTTAAFKIPTDTKLGTVITLKLYYDASQSVQVPEAAAPIVLSLDSPSPYGVIDGDRYGSSYFISKQGIPTTESQHVYVKTKDYLLGYKLLNKTGKISFIVPVTMTYTLKYYTATPEEFGGPQEVIDTVTDTQYITVERAYSYWEIASLEYYIPSFANIYNYSLPNGKVNLKANEKFLNVPSLITRHSSKRDDHVILPRQAIEGIHLTFDTAITSSSGERPIIEFIDLTPYALEMTDELLVKNDYLMFDGSVVLSDEISKKSTPNPNPSNMVHSTNLTHDKVLFTEGQVIDALKNNGVYPSYGNIIYSKHPMSINSLSSDKSFNISINDVTIHTPVICEPIINSDNDKWVQLINPTEEAFHIVLDPDTNLNDFTVKISNSLHHSNRLGYYLRDFSKSYIDPDKVSYIAKKKGIIRNEMLLPFDVYIDTYNDKDPKNDDLIKAGTWIILGEDTQAFYVPMWVNEGVYTAQFRTIAVNGQDKLNNTENIRNTGINNYVATSSKTFQISGRMYGFTIYDISDEGRWKDVFRIKDTTMLKYFEGAVDGTKRNNYHNDYAYYYTVGSKNQYGHESGRYNKYTLPLINGSHPKYNNLGVLKTGYAFRFMLDTTGEMYGSGCTIRIIPTFYYVDKDGKNRQKVDLYYNEEIDGKQELLVKVGKGIDLVNLKFGTTGNPHSKIPSAEIKHTAKVINTTYAKIANQYSPMYSYGDIRITSSFRTFIGVNYASHITGLPSYKKIKELTKESELSLSKYMQRWYGTYKLPTTTYVVPAGYDVYGHLSKYGIDYNEDFWLKDGYIIVNFNIITIDKNGKMHLSYSNGSNYKNRGHCSMWITEGPIIQKKDNKGCIFNFKAGDILLYHANKKYSHDYIGIIY